MGAFSNMDYELQSSEAAVSDAFTEDDAMDMPQTAPVEPATASSPTAAPTPAAASEPATAPNTQSEDEARRAHEASEAKRKAEWDAKQAEKRRAEQAALERLDAMGPAELLKAAAKRVSADTEKLTRRNMKESVAEFIQTKCIDDLGFARLTMHPRKSMIHCFQYISRKAWDYVQDELKANGVQPGPGQQAYGCDIPDDLCYQWAEDYRRPCRSAVGGCSGVGSHGNCGLSRNTTHLNERKETIQKMKNGFTITQRNAVVEQHLWCIDTIMAQYAAFMQTEPVDPDDVYQSLAVRLIRAVNSYDPRKGYLKDYILSQLKREMVRIRSTQTVYGLT